MDTDLPIKFLHSRKLLQSRNLVTGAKLTFTSHKAPVNLTSSSRQFFKNLLSHKISSPYDSAGSDINENDNNTIIGIMLKYQQSLTGQPRMVFTFEFVRHEDLDENDEG